MKRIINIGNKKQAIKDLEQFKNKRYESIEIEFTNVHLLKLNKVLEYKLFSKDSLYVHSSTLWDIMQPVGSTYKHHSHGLEPELIVDILSSLIDTFLIYESYSNRYVVLAHGDNDNPNIIIVIELNAGLNANRNANINKLVTLYPKSNLNKLLEHLDKEKIRYKKWEPNGAPIANPWILIYIII